MQTQTRFTLLSCVLLFIHTQLYGQIVSEHIVVYPGSVNTAVLEHSGHSIAVYGTPPDVDRTVDSVLFTHHRRDVVWAGREAFNNGARVIVPAGDAVYFSDAADYWDEQQPHPGNIQAPIHIQPFHPFWRQFAQSRFHDYAQQTTKIVTGPIPIHQTVKEGDRIEADGITFDVLETPGYTRGSVSYLVQDMDTKIAFTGDLIYGNGRIFDLYSLQDEIPEAHLRGYHGYAARIADTIHSLNKIAAAEPNIIVPARGPLITNPQESIAALISRLRAVYRNYLSMTALRWYFGEDHIQICADRILNPTEHIAPVVWADTVLDQAPDWIRDIQTSRLLLSETNEALLIDCGYLSVIDRIQQFIREGTIGAVTGIYVTHYHNDHTDTVAVAADTFHCPVFTHIAVKDILEHPGAYRMPAATHLPVKNVVAFAEGETLRWNEFTLTFYHYPGQTHYHAGLLVKKDQGESILFVGDSFTPTGIDDYCLLNRNLIHEDTGYFRCLDLLSQIDPHTLLINEHVKQPFRFSPEQIQRLTQAYQERKDLLSELFPWDDPNYGIDEGWARFYPYGQTIAEKKAVLFFTIYNHSPNERRFEVTLHPPKGWTGLSRTQTLTIPPGTEQSTAFTIRANRDIQPGVYVATADVVSNEIELREWAEAMLFVE